MRMLASNLGSLGGKWLIGLLASIAFGGLGGFFWRQWETQKSSLLVELPKLSQELENFWQRPIPLQGPAPEQYHPLARGISAQDCAQCHRQAFEEWSSSLHAQAFGPGIQGQYADFPGSAQGGCNPCHAPLSEQWQELLTPEGTTWQKNPHFQPSLQTQGVTCAVCHLRQHQRYNAPLIAGRESLSPLLHGEPRRTAMLKSAEFCRPCHQHEAGEAIIKGKPLENTYAEWLASPAAAQGQTCQDCHMPEKSHHWKGIHDPLMTAAGVTIATTLHPTNPRKGQKIEATLTLTNSNTGHYFPTYSTPAVKLQASFLDASGKPLGEALAQEYVIQRRLIFPSEPWKELFDTRLAPGDSARLQWNPSVPESAHFLRLSVRVEPDHFYEGFYRYFIERQAPGAEIWQKALVQAQQRAYTLFEKQIPLN